MPLSRLDSLPFVHGYAGLGPEFSREVKPRGLRGVRLLHLSRAGCELLDLDPASIDAEGAAAYFTGNQILPGAKPVAAVYSGHQFGMWAGQLGDGRAMLLGEVQNARGETWDVQLKGAGQTPYSRMGDGRAVLRSTLREYIAGEAMTGLGIPTTRALAIFDSDEPVYREEVEKGALLIRLAQCHVRLGTFEHFHAAGRDDLTRVLFGYSVGRWFPRLLGTTKRAQAFLDEVTDRTARLMAMWMSVGFCHGVMNTDNFSITGDTIDYGPYAFMDDFVWDHICNCSDHQGRYAFSNQPQVGAWNLTRFVEAIASLFPGEKVDALQERVMARYGEVFESEYKSRMAAKLGVEPSAPGFDALLDKTLSLLGSSMADFTGFWRALSHTTPGEESPRIDVVRGHDETLQAWWGSYRAFRAEHPAGGSIESSRSAMLATNPKFVARNHLLQELIDEADRATQVRRIDELLEVLADPFAEHVHLEALAAPPVGAQKALSIGCSS